jgi:hypothetical protein
VASGHLQGDHAAARGQAARKRAGQCQVSRSNGPGGPLGLGLGIRSSPCLWVK